MSTPGFFPPAARHASVGFGLVHVESGAVLASIVAAREAGRRSLRSLLRRRTVPGQDEALVTTPARWVHTFFASSPIDVAFVGRDGRILKVRPEMKPWRVALAFNAHAVIEGAPGLFAAVGAGSGDHVALTAEEAQETAEEEPQPDAVRDTDAGADPWDLGPGREVAVPEPPDAAPGSFEGEPGKGSVPRGPVRPSFSRGVDLARLVDRDTPLFWFEAVAIVQELCAVLLATRRSGAAADLEPGDVAITPEGGVEVRGGIAPGLPPVAHVAHILLTLLGEAQSLPVQLRLLALQEVSPAPSSTTLSEWSARLAPFERPGRQRTIREVYERFTRLPARVSGTPAKEASRARRVRAPRSRWWRNRKVQTAAASVALLVAAGIVAGWLWQVVVPILSGDRDRQKSGAGAAPVAKSLSAEAVERIRAAARRIWLAPALRPAAPAPGATLDARPVIVAAPAGLPSVPSPSPTAAPRTPDAPAGARTAVVEKTVFSSVDAAVVPPSLVRPRLPMNPRPGVRAEDLPLVELLVSQTGEVESVKLLSQPPGVMPTMMLSAIKTWRFEPAKRDGQPVRYRLLMRLTNQ